MIELISTFPAGVGVQQRNCFQIKSLKLGEELLQGRFSKDVISRYKDREPLPQQCRLELTKTYVKYVVGMYCEWYGNRYVGPEIIQYVAEVMVTLYPSLRDEGSDPDNPTFVSYKLVQFLNDLILFCEFYHFEP